MECEIAGCIHDQISGFTGLCKEHEVDLMYWRAQQGLMDNKGIQTYITQKNRELLG